MPQKTLLLKNYTCKMRHYLRANFLHTYQCVSKIAMAQKKTLLKNGAYKKHKTSKQFIVGKQISVSQKRYFIKITLVKCVTI